MNAYMKNVLLSLVALTGLLFSNLASAHEGHDVTLSFMSGLLHPFSGLDHLLVILLVGFWSAFVLKKIWFGPCVFLLGMCIGVLAGFIGLPLTFFEFGIAASVIAIGLLLLAKNQYSPQSILLLIGAFGVFHGFAHAELFSTASVGSLLVAQDIAGLLLATGILHLSGALLVKALKEKTSIFAKIAGFSSLMYGLLLMGQMTLALIGGAAV
ncbi:HupE/UreJ family protein [Polynucleobacter sp. JS-Safj-400b-B2]|nr:HupE/UreJ family protein [Polynucleobacter sp. JS-Safj-400b-B2]